MRNLLHHILALPRNLIVKTIGLYQSTLSPDHGPLKALSPYGYCRHTPSCSQYAKEQIEKRGVMMGSLFGMKQLLTCHPWKKPSDQKVMEILRGL